MNNNKIKISFWGDFAGQGRIPQLIDLENPANIFGELAEEIQNSDIAIANLEAPLIEKGVKTPKSGPNIKAPLILAKALKEVGISLVTLANNHIMDYGVQGLQSTIFACDSYDLEYMGVGANEDEATKIKYVNCKNSKIAFINIAENEFGNATKKQGGGAPLNPVKNYYQITEARHEADYVIVIIHGGHETFEYPSPRMRDTYRYYIDIGADAIIGHHTHCFSGHEIYKGHPIVYSLGNFIFDNLENTHSSWNDGVGAVITLENGTICLELIPFTQGLPDIPFPKIYPLEKKEEFINKSHKKSKVIDNDKLLQSEFEKFVKQSKRKYALYLEPTTNRIILGLINRKILKSFINDKKRLLLLNIIRCEAHRDVLLQILKK